VFSADDENRISWIEERLGRLERLVQSLAANTPQRVAPTAEQPTPVQLASASPQPPPSPKPSSPISPPQAVRSAPPPPRSATRAIPQSGDETGSPVTTLLGWTGATAIVLAAAYLIRLAIDSGWLTPVRQLGLAVLIGLALIVAGAVLRRADRRYAGLLPGAGIVILYLSVYGAHLYYHFIDATTATALIILISLSTLWLGRIFESDLYALFAVVGSYSAPFLLPSLRNNVTDLVIYFTAWNVVFCLHAVWIRNRVVYLLALYLALIGFDVIWNMTASQDWVPALVFQFVQFVLFSACAVIYSVLEDQPMTTEEAIAHLPALLLFYAVQYGLLKQHLPEAAPWIAIGSLGLLAGCYAIAKAYLREMPAAGKMILSAYAALVLFHAGYLELVPGELAPWAAFLLMLAAVFFAWIRLGQGEGSISRPLVFVIGLIFVMNYLRILVNIDTKDVPAKDLLMVLYAAELYVAYYLVRQAPAVTFPRELLLYAGHVSAMAAAVHILDNRFAISLSWGALAVGCLMVSLNTRDKLLGQSSLLVFAASAAKMLLYDLSAATPVIRIASLLVLGVTFYLGGWLYRKVNTLEA
jgi:uncharacterized membrane protein